MADGYNQSYGAGEIAEVSIDLVVGIGASFVAFVALIGLIILWQWIRKKV